MPRELYEFPGYPYPDAKMEEISGKGFSPFPPGHEVAEYIRMFADDMELQQLISFETSVTRLEPIAGGDGWAMHHGKQGEAEVVEQFDFVVVATGMYSSDHVHLPEAEGVDRFQGQIMHSCQFKDASVCQGKNVVVVGGGKSSIDCVVAAAKKRAKAASLVSNYMSTTVILYTLMTTLTTIVHHLPIYLRMHRLPQWSSAPRTGRCRASFSTSSRLRSAEIMRVS